jgi:hypothetical protein
MVRAYNSPKPGGYLGNVESDVEDPGFELAERDEGSETTEKDPGTETRTSSTPSEEGKP